MMGKSTHSCGVLTWAYSRDKVTFKGVLPMRLPDGLEK